ncbi:hypothetical protein JRQ81_018593 [Phrynocephalus forsythii]|uniref:Uncharacterized protein n=1 Tax=Phrynocephalus forsythii TaxID=171643 RepID=A0A9Q0XS76_9SAUR|nr:hypothetical protein JRQ81_018593 [Phrynocephalus forsythii]
MKPISSIMASHHSPNGNLKWFTQVRMGKPIAEQPLNFLTLFQIGKQSARSLHSRTCWSVSHQGYKFGHKNNSRTPSIMSNDQQCQGLLWMAGWRTFPFGTYPSASSRGNAINTKKVRAGVISLQEEPARNYGMENTFNGLRWTTEG